MPFGAPNAPSEFMRLMADVLFEHIDKGYCIVFIDDILVFSRNAEDYEQHVRAVMDTIRKAGFSLHGSNCSFGRSSAPFLGFDINSDGPEGASVRMTDEKSGQSWTGHTPLLLHPEVAGRERSLTFANLAISLQVRHERSLTFAQSGDKFVVHHAASHRR